MSIWVILRDTGAGMFLDVRMSILMRDQFEMVVICTSKMVAKLGTRPTVGLHPGNCCEWVGCWVPQVVGGNHRKSLDCWVATRVRRLGRPCYGTLALLPRGSDGVASIPSERDLPCPVSKSMVSCASVFVAVFFLAVYVLEFNARQPSGNINATNLTSCVPQMQALLDARCYALEVQ